MNLKDENLLSIIIPIYKVERYLSLCVESILKQTYKNLQIILVDDGSPDACPVICDHYVRKDRRIQVIHQRNMGLSAARNVGLDMAKGKYVLFVDSDDCLDWRACDELVKKAEALSADVVTSNFTCINDLDLTETIIHSTQTVNYYTIGDGCIKGEDYLLLQLRHYAYKSIVMPNLYRRSFLVENELYFITGIYREDEEWMPRVFCAADRIAQIDKSFYQYRLRENSIMHDSNLNLLRMKNFLDDVCTNVSQTMGKVNDDLRKNMMQYLLRKCFMEICDNCRYFVAHKEELRLSFWWKNTYSWKLKLWLLILTLDVRLFCLAWRRRGKLKTFKKHKSQ